MIKIEATYIWRFFFSCMIKLVDLYRIFFFFFCLIKLVETYIGISISFVIKLGATY
jgi:hypothetical protein